MVGCPRGTETGQRNALITISNLTLSFSNKILFKDVSLKFTPGNCYGLIGANGSGKSSLLKILSGELEADKGSVVLGAGKRLSVLSQDHFAFESQRVLDTVIMGSPRLHALGKEREALYAKSDFTEADGMRASEVEAEYAELGGWEAEAQAATLLAGLGAPESEHGKLMRDVDEGVKVRVLLAQALFGSPDILLLDEPTNGLDLASISWLEEFLIEFPNIVIVVSHDRHFLNSVCTHTCDIDFGQVRMYAGNYDFWFRINRILAQQQKDERKRREEKVKDLKEFINRFAANVSKSRQATSRKKILEKLEVDDYVASSRRAPYVGFKPARAVGNVVLEIEGLAKSQEGRPVLSGLNLTVRPEDKIAFVGREHLAKTALFQIIANEDTPDHGSFLWGQTITWSYFPKENAALFDSDMPLMNWLAQYSPSDDETFVRSFLGRMLFSGDDGLKPVRVLSGGERVRCLLARLMLSGANCLILDEPTNHLDLEAIEALDEGLVDFRGVLLFTSHDHEFVTSIANRIVEICPHGVIDRRMPFDDYLADREITGLRDRLYEGHVMAEI
jgi:ATPase subunit of ABC transporter with duplicated ATPase domains